MVVWKNTEIGKFEARHLFYCALIGLVVTGLLVWITEYYTGTDHQPVKIVAKASETGHGTNVMQRLAISMEATALPVLVICAGIIAAYFLQACMGLVSLQQQCWHWGRDCCS